MICATETARVLSFTQRLEVLYALAFASQDFTLKLACLVSELEDTEEITAWLEDLYVRRAK